MGKLEESGRNGVTSTEAPLNTQPNEVVDMSPTHSKRSPARYAWQVIQDEDLHPPCYDVPNVPACYVIFVGKQVVYIGQTKRLRHRLGAHRLVVGYSCNEWITPWGNVSEPVTVKVKYSRRYGDWLMREARLIRRLQPPMNCQGSTRKPKRQAVVS